MLSPRSRYLFQFALSLKRIEALDLSNGVTMLNEDNQFPIILKL